MDGPIRAGHANRSTHRVKRVMRRNLKFFIHFGKIVGF